ncbi:hypothetical protein B0H13DRAFT_2674144 [Mycena leptocephala]|nr:hypothetical protein B0H13DRAFT_2674144 [Mycena leptocephala]
MVVSAHLGHRHPQLVIFEFLTVSERRRVGGENPERIAMMDDSVGEVAMMTSPADAQRWPQQSQQQQQPPPHGQSWPLQQPRYGHITSPAPGPDEERFLKIKCDGQKPICGPCRRRPKDDECEYSDGPATSKTKALEDTVQRLEARLHELQHPEDSTPSVTLYDPYPQYASPPQLRISPSYPTSRSLPNTPYHQLPRVLSPSSSSPESQGYTPLSHFSPLSTTATTPPFGMHRGCSPLGIFGSRTSSPSLDIDQNVCEAFLQTFGPHASEFGFFLDWNRFIQSALHSILSDGAHLSSDGQRKLYFKHKALSFAASELTPKSFLHTIQAEVLLSHFFFRTGHFLEARAHTATAVALALGGGLHQIRSLNHPDIPEGERINGFWAVFVLQKNLSVALEPAMGVCGVFETNNGVQIDIPWPLEMDDYRQGLLTSDIHGDSTVRNYLHQTGVPSYQERPSITAMNVKASMLLHRAVYLHGQWRPSAF